MVEVSIFAVVFLLIIFGRTLLQTVEIIKSRQRPQFAYLGRVGIFLILLFFLIVPPLIRPNEHPRFDLDGELVEKLTIYRQENLVPSEAYPQVAEIVEREQLEKWVEILNHCEGHRLNHPNYETTYVVDMTYNGKVFPYWWRIDVSEDGGGVDLVPFERGKMFGRTSLFELGTYRCTSLDLLVDEILR